MKLNVVDQYQYRLHYAALGRQSEALLLALCNRPHVFGMNRQWLATLQESIFLIVWDIHGVFMSTQIHTTIILAHRSLHIRCA